MFVLGSRKSFKSQNLMNLISNRLKPFINIIHYVGDKDKRNKVKESVTGWHLVSAVIVSIVIRFIPSLIYQSMYRIIRQVDWPGQQAWYITHSWNANIIQYLIQMMESVNSITHRLDDSWLLLACRWRAQFWNLRFLSGLLFFDREQYASSFDSDQWCNLALGEKTNLRQCRSHLEQRWMTPLKRLDS